MQYELEATVVVTLTTNGSERSRIEGIDLNFDARIPNKGVLPNTIKATTQCLIQGLVANIHSAHQANDWDSAQHLRYIITELERGFIQQVKVTDKTLDLHG